MKHGKYRVLCFGDSNTWGYIPERAEPDRRFPVALRWTGILQSLLGPQFEIIEEGLNSRTTCVDDPEVEGKNGLTALPAILKQHAPIDLFILLLGTNDLKRKFDRSPSDIANGIRRLVRRVKSVSKAKPPKILVLSPPLPKLKYIYEAYRYPELEDKARQLAAFYKEVADGEQVEFANLAPVIEASTVDGAHLDAEQHHKLAVFLREIVANLSKRTGSTGLSSFQPS